MASAASLTSASGRRARRLAHQPSAAPATVVTADAPSSEMPRARRVVLGLGQVDDLEVGGVDASTAARGSPTARYGVPSRS